MYSWKVDSLHLRVHSSRTVVQTASNKHGASEVVRYRTTFVSAPSSSSSPDLIHIFLIAKKKSLIKSDAVHAFIK